jgi:hypothetical protein
MWRITDDKETTKLRRSTSRPFPGVLSARAFTSIINIIIVMSTVGNAASAFYCEPYTRVGERCCTAYANKYDQTMLFYAKRESRGLSRQREGQYDCGLHRETHRLSEKEQLLQLAGALFLTTRGSPARSETRSSKLGRCRSSQC